MSKKRLIEVKAKNLTELRKKTDKKKSEGYQVLGVFKADRKGNLIATMALWGNQE